MGEQWTPKLVADRMEEAASTLKRLPSDRPKGYASSWPTVIHEFCEAYGWSDAEFRLGPPAAEAITRMDESLEWLRWVSPEETKLIWLRAEMTPWKEIMRRFGGCRTTVWSRWMNALLKIATRLNAAPGRKDV